MTPIDHSSGRAGDSLGFGLGLRRPHYAQIVETRPDVGWFEVISENLMPAGGRQPNWLDRLRADYPIALHGVCLSIGSTDPLDEHHMAELRLLQRRVQPAWISDHLCWTGVDGRNLHDLLPLPYTEAALAHVVERIGRVQDALGCQILLENVSSYVSYPSSEMTEWEFLAEVARQADCLILLDVNNIHVSGVNHGFDPLAYLDGIPVTRVRQMHLAGHWTRPDGLIIDSHGAPVSEPVWRLYEHARRRFGDVATMIERDSNIPPLAELLTELDRARSIAARVDAENAGASVGAERPMQADGRPAVLDLAQLQHEFQGYVLDRDPAVLQHVSGTAAADAATRMSVHVRGYTLKLLGALEADYPVLKAIVGGEEFEALGHAYIAAQASISADLHGFEEGLLPFLDSEPRWSERPELADMARFEWAMARSFDAADENVLSREALTGLTAESWARLRFIVHPAVQRIELRTNAAHAWSAWARGESLPPLRRNAASATWLLTRQELKVRFRAMASEEATAFDRLAAGACFAQWCDELGPGVIAERAVELLNRWLADGAFAGVALAAA
jgi:uncharacterized protein (UPF0276 family)